MFLRSACGTLMNAHVSLRARNNHSCSKWCTFGPAPIWPLVMGDIEIFIYDNCHLKYHNYCKYHDISKLVVTVQQTMKLVGFIT